MLESVASLERVVYESTPSLTFAPRSRLLFGSKRGTRNHGKKSDEKACGEGCEIQEKTDEKADEKTGG
jgi:hypothetical protein